MKHVFGNVMKCAAPFAALILASCHVIWSDFSNPYDLENMTIRTYAGKGGTTGSYSGDNESAASAGLSSPVSIAFDSADNLYISDSGNDRVRKVSAATGIITTVAGGGTGLMANGVAATSVSVGGGSLQGIALDSSGNLYIATSWSNQILKVDAAGTLTIVAGSGGLSSPMGVAVDSAGDLYIADSNNYRVLRVDASTSVITTVAGNGTSSYSGDGGPATSAGFYPRSIALDSSGDIFITDTWATRIREVDASTGIISSVPLPGADAWGNIVNINSDGVAIDAAGDVIVAATAGNVVQVATKSSRLTTIAGTLWSQGYSGDGGASTSALLNQPEAVAVDSKGSIYIADTGNNCIRRIGR